MKEAQSQAYANSRVDPEDVSRRLYDLPRDTPYSMRMAGARMPRNYDARRGERFGTVYEHIRYSPGKNWAYKAVQWPQRRGSIALLDVGPYRVQLRGYPGCVKVRCDCGKEYFIDCGLWLARHAHKPPPEACAECYRRKTRNGGVSTWQGANRATFGRKPNKLWVGDDVTLAKAKKARFHAQMVATWDDTAKGGRR